MKSILWFLPVVFLSGCLLNQSDPAPVSKKPFLLGSVSLEHLQVSNSGVLATINAEFAVKAEDKPAPTPIAASLASPSGRWNAVRSFFSQASSSSRAPMCQKRTIEKNPKVDPKATAPAPSTPFTRVSVGKLAFGAALQSSFLELKADQNYHYTAVLPTVVPAGLYQIAAEGAEFVDSFGEILSVPEEVRSLRLNGMDFGNPTMEFDPSRPLEVFWREPGIANDQNGILAELSMQDANYTYALTCALREEDIPTVKGYKVWNLDSAWFSELPKTGSVEFYFLRAHLRTPTTKRSKVQMQASRTFYVRLPLTKP